MLISTYDAFNLTQKSYDKHANEIILKDVYFVANSYKQYLNAKQDNVRIKRI